AGIDMIGVGQRRFQVPDAFELPRVGRPVVPLMGPWHAVVGKLVPDRLPCLPAVARSLDELPEPAAALRRIEPIRVGRGPFEVINLPPAEGTPAHAPLFALAVGSQSERAFARTNQYPHSAHASLLC